MYSFRMRTILFTLVSLLFLPVIIAADSDIHFSADGKISAKGLIVQQVSGSTIYVRAIWGETFLRMAIAGSPATVVSKAYGESSTIAEIKEKNVIDVTGMLASGGDSIVINAVTVRNSNLKIADKVLSGPVTAVNVASSTFVMEDKTYGKTTVAVSGASLKKGVLTIGLVDIKIGDQVVSTTGAYNHEAKTLTAQSVSLNQDLSQFKPKNFEGKLKTIISATHPITLVVTVGSTDYMVYLTEKASILNSARKAAALSRSVVGDAVRFWGGIRPSNLTEVDAEIL